MYDRILMAVDHSDVAERVINAARETSGPPLHDLRPLPIGHQMSELVT